MTTTDDRAPAVSIADLVVARAHDDRVGLRFEEQSWTWAEVVREAQVRAAVLQSTRGPGPFHVGVLLENVPEYLFLLAGAALAGATVVGVNSTRRGDDLGRDIRHTDCGLLITEQRLAELVDGLDTGVPSDRTLVVESDRWTQLVGRHAGAAAPALLPGPDALFTLIFTSGSTGAPKAVRVTQGRMAETAAGMGFTPDDVLYCAMPLFHGNALAASVVPALASGATLVLRRRFSASAFLPDVRHFHATFFNTVGRALAYILATPPSDHDRDHDLKFGLGPESSDVDVAAFRARFGCPVFGGYGSSEGAIRMLPVRAAHPGALGVPPDDMDVAVVDPETGEECAVAEFDDHGRLLNAAEAIGEIVRRDPAMRFEGYYNNPEAEAERTRNGWYWSGDLAYRDDAGVYYFAGRTADWLRVDAENFAAAPVERIIARHPAVAGVAVYAVPDTRTGDQVMAAVELRTGEVFDPAEFLRFLTSQPDLGTKWTPRFVRIVDALPVTGADKIDKKPLRGAQWYGRDPIWWQPERDAPYRRLRAADVARLEADLATHGRESMLTGRG